MARIVKAPPKSITLKKRTLKVVSPPEDLHDETEENESMEESEEPSEDDEDSEYGSSRKNGNPPPAKRAKKSSVEPSAKKSIANSSRKKKSLSMLLSMPLDVLFEVFSHLRPEDIIHLSRTSRIFRDTLMARNATTVWKGARERFGAPVCPSNMSEPQWAVLLFGNLCQGCGAKKTLKPEFGLLRRICVSCKKENFLLKSRFKTQFPDVDAEVLDLIPYTNIGALSQGYVRRSGRRFFWTPDIHAMLRKVAEYEHNIHLHRPGAPDALQKFKSQQVSMVASIRESIRDREKWCEEFALGCYKDKEAAMDRRFEPIKAKFIALGYDATDVEHIRSSRECQQSAFLTDRIWNRIRPILEPTLLEKKRERLERDLENIRSERRQIIHALYREYKKTLTPPQWRYLPRTIDVCAMEPFAQVVDAVADVNVSAADFEDAFRELPRLIAAEVDARKVYARNLLKLSNVEKPTSSTSERGEITEASSPSSFDILDLATSVFKCREESCGFYHEKTYLFGWEEISTHYCKADLNSVVWLLRPEGYDLRPGPLKIEFSTEGSEIAAVIVRALGLDETVATVREVDMETEDVRFGCSVCPPVKKNANSWTNAAYRWQDFVSHCALRSHSPKDVLVLLPSEIVTRVKEVEMTNLRVWSQWTCVHCSIHVDGLQLRQIVVEHLKSAHGITSPREPDDLARDPSSYTFEVGYPVESPGNEKTLRCLECANGKRADRKRVFDDGGMRSHLSAKHKVKCPVVGVHFQ